MAVEKVATECQDLWNEFEELERTHKEYLETLNNLTSLQNKCQKSVKQLNNNIGAIKKKLRQAMKDNPNLIDQEKLKHADLQSELTEHKARLDDVKQSLPKEDNGLYLRVILGKVNISILNKAERFRYKDDYEKFKLTLTFVSLVVAVIALIFKRRVFDAVFHFLLVWYYCTLTIRESILRINGSRIKGWWVLHHYVSAVLCGVFVTWPDGSCYQSFRKQFLIFSIYLMIVQFIQFVYQRGSLYRLRTLGVRDQMDITVDGFHSWMFRGLGFVLPFLFAGYVFQLYNSYVLFKLWREQRCQAEWQIVALCGLFCFVALGNAWTTFAVVYNKYTGRDKPGRRRRLQTKYSLDMSDPVMKKDT